MESILTKYNSLSPAHQNEVKDFLDFMVSKTKSGRRFNMKGWKKRIQKVSVWTAKDITMLKKNSQSLRSWNPPGW